MLPALALVGVVGLILCVLEALVQRSVERNGARSGFALDGRLVQRHAMRVAQERSGDHDK